MIRVYHNGYEWLARLVMGGPVLRRDTADEALQRAWEVWGSQPALIQMRRTS